MHRYSGGSHFSVAYTIVPLQQMTGAILPLPIIKLVARGGVGEVWKNCLSFGITYRSGLCIPGANSTPTEVALVEMKQVLISSSPRVSLFDCRACPQGVPKVAKCFW